MRGNPNLREALDLARRLGCAVEPMRRSGEVRIVPPGSGLPVVVNARRKDSPRVLVVALRRLERGES
jgi:hypothetical protein